MSKNEATISYTLLALHSHLFVVDDVKEEVDAPNKLSCKVDYLGMNEKNNSFGIVYTTAYYVTEPARFSVLLSYAVLADFPDAYDADDVRSVYDETIDAIAKRVSLVISFISDQVFGSPISLPPKFDEIKRESFDKHFQS